MRTAGRTRRPKPLTRDRHASSGQVGGVLRVDHDGVGQRLSPELRPHGERLGATHADDLEHEQPGSTGADCPDRFDRLAAVELDTVEPGFRHHGEDPSRILVHEHADAADRGMDPCRDRAGPARGDPPGARREDEPDGIGACPDNLPRVDQARDPADLYERRAFGVRHWGQCRVHNLAVRVLP